MDSAHQNQLLYPIQKYHQDYKRYQQITGIKVFVIWKDETKDIEYYGNFLDELEKNIHSEYEQSAMDDQINFNYPDAFIQFNNLKEMFNFFMNLGLPK